MIFLIFTDLPLFSHVSDSKQIGSLWVTSNLLLLRESILSYYFGTSNKEAFNLDFLGNLFLGEGFISIIRMKM